MCLYPPTFRPASAYNVSVTVLQASGKVKIEASLASSSGSVIATKSAEANGAGNLQ